jgi:hypothetical protein
MSGSIADVTIQFHDLKNIELAVKSDEISLSTAVEIALHMTFRMCAKTQRNFRFDGRHTEFLGAWEHHFVDKTYSGKVTKALAKTHSGSKNGREKIDLGVILPSDYLRVKGPLIC